MGEIRRLTAEEKAVLVERVRRGEHPFADTGPDGTHVGTYAIQAERCRNEPGPCWCGAHPPATTFEEWNEQPVPTAICPCCTHPMTGNEPPGAIECTVCVAHWKAMDANFAKTEKLMRETLTTYTPTDEGETD